MFAVMKTGGKQYRVAVGDRLKVEKVSGEAGDIVEFSEVMMVGDQIGAPLLDGALVAAEIVEQGRALVQKLDFVQAENQLWFRVAEHLPDLGRQGALAEHGHILKSIRKAQGFVGLVVLVAPSHESEEKPPQKHLTGVAVGLPSKLHFCL